VVNKK